MVQQKIELKPDVVLKQYWNDNEHFADFFNAVLFQGEAVIKSQDLCDVDSQETTVVENKKMMKSMQMTRDVVKLCKHSNKHNVEFVLLGMESQEHIHYAMPMRVMGYDYIAYKKQYDANAKNYKEASSVTEDEYLSRMRKVDKSVVITAAGAANCKIDYSQIEAKGEVDMCTVFEETWQDGLNEGLEQGENNMICKMHRNGMSIRDIVILTGLTEKRIQEALRNGQDRNE